MKISEASYDRIYVAISKLVNTLGKDHIEKYIASIATLPEVNDPALRARWDILLASVRQYDFDLYRDLYAEGLNDQHIDTALRRVLRTLGISIFAS